MGERRGGRGRRAGASVVMDQDARPSPTNVKRRATGDERLRLDDEAVGADARRGLRHRARRTRPRRSRPPRTTPGCRRCGPAVGGGGSRSRSHPARTASGVSVDEPVDVVVAHVAEDAARQQHVGRHRARRGIARRTRRRSRPRRRRVRRRRHRRGPGPRARGRAPPGGRTRRGTRMVHEHVDHVGAPPGAQAQDPRVPVRRGRRRWRRGAAAGRWRGAAAAAIRRCRRRDASAPSAIRRCRPAGLASIRSRYRASRAPRPSIPARSLQSRRDPGCACSPRWASAPLVLGDPRTVRIARCGGGDGDHGARARSTPTGTRT